MATFTFLSLIKFILLIFNSVTEARIPGNYTGGPWKPARATFYGGWNDASNNMGGGCGYKNMYSEGYGVNTAALSYALFKDGKTCGACFELRCIKEPQWCLPGNPAITVTATNSCPPNYTNDGWCNPPREHFDLSMPMFLKIAKYKAGVVPVSYRRVPCRKQGGMHFTLTGNKYFCMVLVTNVAGVGDISQVWVKGERTEWLKMGYGWGPHWNSTVDLVGQSLSFRVQGSDRRKSTSWNIAPSDWQFGQTFIGKNFRV